MTSTSSKSGFPNRKRHSNEHQNDHNVEKRARNVETCQNFGLIGLESGRFYFTKVASTLDCFNENCYSLKDLLCTINPEQSIHFNFMIDVKWLMRQYPESSKNNPIDLIVGQQMGTHASELIKDVATLGLPNVKVSGARLPMPYGTHHTKISLMKRDDKIHIIVSTANLVEGDWAEKTQMFYYCTAQLGHSGDGKSCAFQQELIGYFKHYNLSPVAALIKLIESADFGDNPDHFIYSVPGYHKAEKEKIAQLGLRNALSNKPQDAQSLYVTQCSSIGSLGQKPEQWFISHFLTSLRGGAKTGSNRIFLVYPTVEEVRSSYEGYSAGGSLPYQSATHEKQTWLRSYLCKWRSDNRGRNRAMPHVKSYCEIGSDRHLKWLLVTSANLSKAAWGELQKNGEQLAVRSWEAGVLIQDPTRCELPYDYPLCRYQDGDRPWIVDKNYTDADSHGCEWLNG